MSRGDGPQVSLALELLRCPETGAALRLEGDELVAPSGRRWPAAGGVARFLPGSPADRPAPSAPPGGWGVCEAEGFLVQLTGLAPTRVAGRTVLELGAGAGRLTEVLLAWGARVLALEPGPAVEVARRLLPSDRLVLARAGAAALPCAPGAFDLVLALGADARALPELVARLRPGGELCFWPATPAARATPRRALVRALEALLPGATEPSDLIETLRRRARAADGPSPEDVARWLRSAGLTEVRALPFRGAARGRRPQR